MERVAPATFIEDIKKAKFICAPEYGSFLYTERVNPYHKQPFQWKEEEHYEAYRVEKEEGIILYLKKEGRLCLTAFLVP